MRIPGLELDVLDQRIDWRATRYPGVDWLPLHLGPELHASGPDAEARETAVLIRMAPGCGYPAHRHVGVEEVLVLRGGYRDDRGEHVAGSYVRYDAGSTHAPIALGRVDRPEGPENPACLLFATAREGTVVVAPE